MTCEKCGVETNQFQLSKIKGKFRHDVWICRLCHFWENEERGEFIIAGMIVLLTVVLCSF
jgi:protein-arginine kinase activator protein McsA